MEKIAKSIIKAAREQGACSLTNKVSDIKTLAELFFTPQGIEFCEEHNFPTPQDFRELNKFDISKYGVYVDAGAIQAFNRETIALVGETQATLSYEGSKRLHTVILMHGAEARIIARDYAVLHIVNISGKANVDADKTALML